MLRSIGGEGSEVDYEKLCDNLDELREFIRLDSRFSRNVYNGIVKLSDHVRLEVQRDRDYNVMIHFSETDIHELDSKMRSLRADLDDAQKGMQRYQMETVAILGIFAAVVMAFSGGFDLLGGILSTSGDSNIYNVIFATLLCGIIFFDILAFLMYMILAIIRYQDSSGMRYHTTILRKSSRARLSARLDSVTGSRFIILFNSLMIAMMAVDLAFMYAS